MTRRNFLWRLYTASIMILALVLILGMGTALAGGLDFTVPEETPPEPPASTPPPDAPPQELQYLQDVQTGKVQETPDQPYVAQPEDDAWKEAQPSRRLYTGGGALTMPQTTTASGPPDPGKALVPGQVIDTAAMTRLGSGPPQLPPPPPPAFPLSAKVLTGIQVVLMLGIIAVAIILARRYYSFKNFKQYGETLKAIAHKVAADIDYTRQQALDRMMTSSVKFNESGYAINEEDPVYLPHGYSVVSITGADPLEYSPEGVPNGGLVVEIGDHHQSLMVTVLPGHGNVEIIKNYEAAVVMAVPDQKPASTDTNLQPVQG